MALWRAVSSLRPGASFSTHHVSDEQAVLRIGAEGRAHLIFAESILEWLDDAPMPSVEEIEAELAAGE